MMMLMLSMMLLLLPMMMMMLMMMTNEIRVTTGLSPVTLALIDSGGETGACSSYSSTAAILFDNGT